MESPSHIRQEILSRCLRIKSALDDCPKSGLLRFYQRWGEIRAAAETDADEKLLQNLDSQLDALIEELQVTDDANGEKILGFSRWEKFM